MRHGFFFQAGEFVTRFDQCLGVRVYSHLTKSDAASVAGGKLIRRSGIVRYDGDEPVSHGFREDTGRPDRLARRHVGQQDDIEGVQARDIGAMRQLFGMNF